MERHKTGEYCIYLRKSRADLAAEQRGEGETLARHQAALTALTKQLGLQVTEIYREIVSGETIADRPVMQRLLAQVEGGRWAGVAVMEIERLARGDTVDQGLMARAFSYSGTKIYTPLKTYDPNNEFDQEYFEFGLFMSRREYKAINRRLQRGRLASVEEGKFVGSRAPYGYSREKLAGDKGYTLAPHFQEAPVVELIFRWYVRGVGGVRMGVSALASRLTGLGIPAANGGGWSPSSLRDLLRNPVYTGMVRWNWRPVVKGLADGKQVRSRPRGDRCILVRGLHPAIVDPALWQMAQALLSANSIAKAPSGVGVQNPLAGLILCGLCGRRMVRKANKNAADSLLCATPGCSAVSAPLAQVEARLVDGLVRWLGDYSVTPLPPAAEDNADPRVAARLRADLAALDQQKSALHDLLEQGIYDSEVFRDRRKTLEDRTAQLADSLATLEREQRQLREAAPSPPLWEIYAQASPARKNALLKTLVDHIVYLRPPSTRWAPAGFTLHVFPLLRPQSN